MPTPVPPTAAPQPSPAPVGGKQLVAFVENWKPCPTLDKIKVYSKAIISFAVSYTWSPGKNQCSNSCTIGSPVPVCDNSAQPGLIQQWKAAGTKVLLSFGGAGMGGSWAGDANDCWESCFGKVDSIVTQLTTIVNQQGFDGVDIDYEYHHTAMSEAFLRDLTTQLKASLGDKVVSHAPMDGDISVGKSYFNVLKEVASSVDYLLPQYYNGPFRPANDLAPALAHYGNLVTEIFGGDASKVLFGFCISDCSSTGSNVNSGQAVEIMKNVIAAYHDCGGAYIWAASDDVGWSDSVALALGSKGAAPTPAPALPTPSSAPSPPVAGNATYCSGQWTVGTATFYGDEGQGGHCGGNELGPYGTGDNWVDGLYVATASNLWCGNGGLASCGNTHASDCGRCYEVECTGTSTNTDGYEPCTGQAVTVVVTDECPAGAGHCGGQAHHFDLSTKAFKGIGHENAGVIDIRYRQVDCSPPSDTNMKLAIHGHAWWAKVAAKDIKGPGSVSLLEVKTTMLGDWSALKPDYGQFWKWDSYVGDGPYQFRITLEDGQQLVYEMPGNQLQTGTDIDTGLQFATGC